MRKYSREGHPQSCAVVLTPMALVPTETVQRKRRCALTGQSQPRRLGSDSSRRYSSVEGFESITHIGRGTPIPSVKSAHVLSFTGVATYLLAEALRG